MWGARAEPLASAPMMECLSRAPEPPSSVAYSAQKDKKKKEAKGGLFSLRKVSVECEKEKKRESAEELRLKSAKLSLAPAAAKCKYSLSILFLITYHYLKKGDTASLSAADTLSIADYASSDDDEEAEEVEAEKEQIAEPPSPEMRNIIVKQKVRICVSKQIGSDKGYSLNQASGGWTLADVGSLLGKLTAEKIKAALKTLVPSASDEVETLWVTSIVAAYLQHVWPRQRTNWDLVVQKAKRWVSKQAKSLAPSVDFEAEATKFVKANV
jgi:hypothetical protein